DEQVVHHLVLAHDGAAYLLEDPARGLDETAYQRAGTVVFHLLLCCVSHDHSCLVVPVWRSVLKISCCCRLPGVVSAPATAAARGGTAVRSRAWSSGIPCCVRCRPAPARPRRS